MIELLIEMLFEACLQIFGEVLVELGLRSLAQPFEKRESRNPVLAFVGYFIFGAVTGGVSLLLFPRSFVSHSRFHGLSLFLAPLLAGLTMSGLGRWRQRHGKPVYRLDSFAYGFIFAFGMALVRFYFTTKA